MPVFVAFGKTGYFWKRLSVFTTLTNQNNTVNYSPCIFTVDAGSSEDTYFSTFPLADCRGAGDQKKPQSYNAGRVPWKFLKLCLYETFLK